jgi:hypothetical protein
MAVTLTPGEPVKPVTGIAVERVVFVPSPSCPEPFAPQHEAPPPLLIAQACEVPAVIAVTLATPMTPTGVMRFVVVPSPS